MNDPELIDISMVKADAILEEVSRRDTVMKELAGRIGYFSLQPGGDHFESLVESIVYQQLAGKAAAAIYRKLLGELGGVVTPEKLDRLTDDQFRRAGISPQKLRYLRDLSSKMTSGELELEGIESLGNEDVISRLTTVKGIGRWTAQMFLIFTLGRLDVLPLNDLGFRNALQKHYGLKGKITDARIEKIAKKWSPFRTAGVWLLWESENIKLPAQDAVATERKQL